MARPDLHCGNQDCSRKQRQWQGDNPRDHRRQLRPGEQAQQHRQNNAQGGNVRQLGAVRMLAHEMARSPAVAEHFPQQAAQLLRRLLTDGEARIAVGAYARLAHPLIEFNPRAGVKGLVKQPDLFKDALQVSSPRTGRIDEAGDLLGIGGAAEPAGSGSGDRLAHPGVSGRKQWLRTAQASGPGGFQNFRSIRQQVL